MGRRDHRYYRWPGRAAAGAPCLADNAPVDEVDAGPGGPRLAQPLRQGRALPGVAVMQEFSGHAFSVPPQPGGRAEPNAPPGRDERPALQGPQPPAATRGRWHRLEQGIRKHCAGGAGSTRLWRREYCARGSARLQGVFVMRQAIGSGVPREDLFAQPGPALRAEVGDTLIVGSEGAAGIPRIGEIVAVVGPHGLPPYRVRWLAGEYESLIEPGRSARVQKGHLARQTRDAPGASRRGSRIPPPRRGIREGHRGRVPRPPAARRARPGRRPGTSRPCS